MSDNADDGDDDYVEEDYDDKMRQWWVKTPIVWSQSFDEDVNCDDDFEYGDDDEFPLWNDSGNVICI